MDILKTVIFEDLFGYILQGFAIVLGVYAFNKQKLNFKKYMLASILVMFFSFLVRYLPISYGVHTILNILFSFLICTLFLGMPGYSTVRSTLFVTVLLLINEMVLVAIMISILGQEKFEDMMQYPIEKAILVAPASISFALIVYIAYYILVKRSKNKGEHSGNISK